MYTTPLYQLIMAFPYLIIFTRFFAAPLFFVGYILYQKLVKRKKWASLTTDVIYTVFFLAVYFGFYFLVTQ